MKQPFIVLRERNHTEYITGKPFKIYSVHQSNLCIDIPHTMLSKTSRVIQNYVDSMRDTKVDYPKISDCVHNKK